VTRFATSLGAIAIAVVLAGCGGSSDKTVSTSPVLTTPRVFPASAGFWSAQDGVLGLTKCGAGRHACRGEIERTTDGGRTYRVVLRPSDRITAFDTVGSRGAIAYTSTGKTWRSNDGGRTWARVPRQVSVTWATPRIGLRTALGKDLNSIDVSATHDGGKTWQRLPSPCHMLGPIPSASLPSPSRWWLFCAGQPDVTGPPNGERALFSTIDAGKHWKLVGSATARTLPASAGGPIFAANGFGFLLGYPRVFVTRDGGETLTKLPAGIEPVAAFSDGMAYALKIGHPLPVSLLETHDYGRTWQVVRRWTG
jgi:photosystem II stability/assembly factor-like uncharacterized protein